MKHCKVTINERSFSANYGDLLLDSAILNGVELPHDCRAGVCGTCSVRLVAGKVEYVKSCDPIRAEFARVGVVRDLQHAATDVSRAGGEELLDVRAIHW